MAESFLNKSTNMISFSSSSYKKINFFYFLKSLLAQKLINILTKGGKKIKAEKVFINYLMNLKNYNLIYNPVISFFSLLEILKLPVDLISIRKGKRIYSIPVPVRPSRQYSVAIRSFRLLLKKKKNIPFFKFLMEEHIFILTDKTKSRLLQKKKNILSTSMENRMFTHFRWY